MLNRDQVNKLVAFVEHNTAELRELGTRFAALQAVQSQMLVSLHDAIVNSTTPAEGTVIAPVVVTPTPAPEMVAQKTSFFDQFQPPVNTPPAAPVEKPTFAQSLLEILFDSHTLGWHSHGLINLDQCFQNKTPMVRVFALPIDPMMLEESFIAQDFPFAVYGYSENPNQQTPATVVFKPTGSTVLVFKNIRDPRVEVELFYNDLAKRSWVQTDVRTLQGSDRAMILDWTNSFLTSIASQSQRV